MGWGGRNGNSAARGVLLLAHVRRSLIDVCVEERCMGEQLVSVRTAAPLRALVGGLPRPHAGGHFVAAAAAGLLWFALTHPPLDALANVSRDRWTGRRPGAGLALAGGWGAWRLRATSAGAARRRGGAVRDLLRLAVPPAPVEGGDDLAGCAGRPGAADAPVLDPADKAGRVDLVRVGLVTGQAPADFADTEREPGACVRRAAVPGPGSRARCADAGAGPRGHPGRPDPRLPITGEVDLAGLPVGWCEDGMPWRLRLAATHVLIAGATGSGKGLGDWSLIRALLPAIAAGWVQVSAIDPKRMELSFGRALFHRYACQATAMVELLEAAVAEMHARAEQFGGRTDLTPSMEFPFLVVLVDELAF